MANLVVIAVVFLIQQGIRGVHIVSISGPEVVRSGSELKLDCDYDYMAEEESQLDLKWYFNGSPVPVYQWVPSMKKGPQVIGDMFRESLDLAFVAHNDTYKRHRALRVARADQRFSGTYQCKVSSFVDEDFQQKEVLVYTPPHSVQIHPAVTGDGDKYLNVSCEVAGVYPLPVIDLSWSNNSTTEYLERMDTVVRTQASGLLEVTVTSVLPRDTFTAEVVIACDVTIPNTGDTPHLVREELHPYQTARLTSKYTSGGPTPGAISGLILCVLLLVKFHCTQLY